MSRGVPAVKGVPVGSGAHLLYPRSTTVVADFEFVLFDVQVSLAIVAALDRKISSSARLEPVALPRRSHRRGNSW